MKSQLVHKLWCLLIKLLKKLKRLKLLRYKILCYSTLDFEFTAVINSLD